MFVLREIRFNPWTERERIVNYTNTKIIVYAFYDNISIFQYGYLNFNPARFNLYLLRLFLSPPFEGIPFQKRVSYLNFIYFISRHERERRRGGGKKTIRRNYSRKGIRSGVKPEEEERGEDLEVSRESPLGDRSRSPPPPLRSRTPTGGETLPAF